MREWEVCGAGDAVAELPRERELAAAAIRARSSLHEAAAFPFTPQRCCKGQPL